ncbi:D-alanyl-D-alanine carboxypeptidase family protein [Candidatus Woesearchaeota archaeon]|nr:D-alanyl-D-alanine carboxypeptidase family protein [Candidatus Woesearchaeota archaeon]
MNKNSPLKYPIGKRQFDLLKTYQKAESALFYIDQSAKYSLQQAVYDLAQNGASVSEFEINELNLNQIFIKNKCGKFKDAYIWYELKKDESGNYVKNQCFDSDKNFLIINLIYLFHKNLDQYLTNSPYNIPLNNYDYEIKDSLELIGKAKSPLKFDILKDETKPVVKKPVEIQRDQQKLEDFTEETEENLCAKGIKCILTEEAYNLLLDSQKIAIKKGKRLVVNSAYRSQEGQLAIWNKFAATYPNVEDRRKRVCNPINIECPHTTGNAVDVVFKEKTTKTMDINDWILLHDIMSEAGWVRYGVEKRFDIGEPWHFECCRTKRYIKAKEEEKRTGKKVTAIV